MKVFGLGAPEFFVILLMVVLLFGWKIFPKLGTSIGRFFGSIKREVGNDGQWDDETTETKNAPTPMLAAPGPAATPATGDIPRVVSKDSLVQG